jgi:flagellar biosynthesis protein FlhB
MEEEDKPSEVFMHQKQNFSKNRVIPMGLSHTTVWVPQKGVRMSEKRFPASRKRQREAKARGDTPRAALLNRGAAMLGGVLGLWWQAPSLQRIFLDTAWLEWPLLWWGNVTQLSRSLLLICGSGALAAYLVGSLAGGFFFSAKSLRGSSGASRLSPSAAFFISLGLSLVFLGFVGYEGVRWLSGLSWASAATDEGLLAGFAGSLFVHSVLFLGLAVILGALQAILSWYVWSQRHQRTSQQFAQDTKEEEGAAKHFFSSKITEHMKRPG